MLIRVHEPVKHGLIRRNIVIFIACIAIFGHSHAQSDQQASIASSLAARTLLLDITDTGQSYIAVGQRGHVLRAEHCQSDWQQIIVPTQTTLNAVYFQDESTGWIVGHDAVILKSENGGHDWRVLHQDTVSGEALFDIVFLDHNRGIAIGSYGSYLYTMDGGQNWQSGTLYGEDDFHLYSIAVMPGGELIVSGEAGAVYLSVDEGSHWEKLKVPYDGSFFGALALSDEQLFIYGMRSHIYTSSDLGYSWTKISVNNQNSLSAAILSRNGHIVMAGDAGVLLHSADARKFTRKQSGQRSHRVALTECRDGSFMAVGEAGLEQIEF